MIHANKPTFPLVYSVLLVTLLVIIVSPVISDVSIQYMIGYTAPTTETDGEWSVEYFFVEDNKDITPNPGISKENFIMVGDPPQVLIALDSVFITEDQFTVRGQKLIVPIPKLTIATDPVPTLIAQLIYGGIPYGDEIEREAVNGALTIRALLFFDNTNNAYLVGRGFAIITDYTDEQGMLATPADAVKPTLRSNTPFLKRAWTDHSWYNADFSNRNVFMPNLRDHFLDNGGTLDLRVIDGNNDPENVITAVDIAGKELGLVNNLTDAEIARTGTSNSKIVVINEIMWAVDDQYFGQDEYTREQWIEIFNNTTAPIELDRIWIYPSKVDPASNIGDDYTDRVSTIPDFVNSWSELKGQSGNSGNPDGSGNVDFISMYRLDSNQDGFKEDNWTATTTTFATNYRGTPGARNRIGGIRPPRTKPSQYNPPMDAVVINELYNDKDDREDWLELRALKDTNLEKWVLTKVIGVDAEEVICSFKKETIHAGEVLLIVNTEPEINRLVVGQNVEITNDDNQARGAGPHRYMIIDDFEIPNVNGGDYLLTLRSDNDTKWLGNREHLHDVVGTGTFEHKTLNRTSVQYEEAPGIQRQIWQTRVWPINGHSEIRDAHNDDVDSLLDNDKNFAVGKAWARNDGKQGWLRDGGDHIGYQGGIGYGRNVDPDKALGTPGYANDIIKDKIDEITDYGTLIISELMLTTDNGRYPQWIELHNTSKTNGIHLAADDSDPKDGWQLKIENHNSGKWKDNTLPLNVTVNLKDWFSYIPPNQTVLIAAYKSNNSNRAHFPDTRVVDVRETKRLEFGIKGPRDTFLNADGGFTIQIYDAEGILSDEVGNLDGQAPNLRAGIGLDDPVGFDWSTEMADNGNRTSLIRLRDNGIPRIGVPTRNRDGSASNMQGAVIPMGMQGRPAGFAWVHAVDTGFEDVQYTWYGSKDDYGTPSHTVGTPLPVNLSYFRPTLEDGKVVIRWTTESELNNAGFNILRSETRNGEFKQVNTQLIQGAGTTGERNSYKWVDTSAKHGVIYYYQIEDVSLLGESGTIAKSRLKGMISARNRKIYRWDQLKLLDYDEF